jgi:hypothetical protein
VDKENIDPGTSSLKTQISKKLPPTINLSEIMTLLEESRNEAFDLDAYVTLPVDTFSEDLALSDHTFAIQDMIYKSSKYHFKLIFMCFTPVMLYSSLSLVPTEKSKAKHKIPQSSDIQLLLCPVRSSGHRACH